jgi:hypothetical protein
MHARDKHSSLLLNFVNFGCKKFHNFGTLDKGQFFAKKNKMWFKSVLIGCTNIQQINIY